VVGGATRGAGRGVARAFGEIGAVVYCTGRSTSGAPSSYARPETIDETAELVRTSGGTGIAVRVDHANAAEVKALFDRVIAEQKRIDVFVDSVAGEDPLYGPWTSSWDNDFSQASSALQQGLVTRVLGAAEAARHMKAKKRGLIVEVTGADFPFYGGNLVHQLVMLGHKGLAFHLAEELRPYKVAALSITPGFLRSESMLEHFGVTEATWREGGATDRHFLHSESPLLIGRACVALARDPNLMGWSGHLTSSWEVAAHFGLRDADGSNPDWGGNWTHAVMKEMAWMREGTERQVTWLDRVADRLRGYMKG
jgi:NAD(P)-dependent dehydrogenase (short-subunit alcohol dehydrogenase family)